MSLQPIKALEIIPEESWYKIFHQVESADLQTQSRISQVCKDFKRINSTVRLEKINIHWEKIKNQLGLSPSGQASNLVLFFNIFKKNEVRNRELNAYVFFEKSGIEINKKTVLMSSPLVAVSRYPELIRIAKYLFKNREALPNVEEIQLTPLHIAAVSNNLAMCRLLIENGALINTQSLSGNTPLHKAISSSENNVLETCQIFVQAGANISITNHAGNTPLHEAAIRAKDRGDPEVYDYLLQLPNINKDILNKEGKKAAEYLPSLPFAPPPSTTESVKGSGSL